MHAVLEITVGHRPFSNQFQHLVDQISCTFSMGQQSVIYNISYFQILIFSTAHDHQTLFEHNLILCGCEMDICLAHAK